MKGPLSLDSQEYFNPPKRDHRDRGFAEEGQSTGIERIGSQDARRKYASLETDKAYGGLGHRIYTATYGPRVCLTFNWLRLFRDTLLQMRIRMPALECEQPLHLSQL